MIHFWLNGERVVVETPAGSPLLDTLQTTLNCDDVGADCRQGHCGSCTIMLDGVATRTCTFPTTAANDSHLLTRDGAALLHGATPRIRALYAAFAERGLFECALCPSGFFMALVAHLQTAPDASTAALREVVAAHHCDCLRYRDIYAAIAAVAPTPTQSETDK